VTSTTTGRAVLLRHTSEANFEDWVIRMAERYGWCGFHVRISLAAVRGVHTARRHKHADAYGWPDWIFYKAGGPILYRELKTDLGYVRGDQKECHARLRSAGADVGVWRPSDEALILATFRRVA
jgi:hypothetical protein